MYSHLFSEIQLGSRTLRNRVALPATLTNYASGNRITERWKNFLIERAKGGVGLIISEIIAVDPEALAQQAIVTGFDDTNEFGFQETSEAVHKEGALLVGQLWHPGRQQLWHPTKAPMGVSEQPDALSWTVPHVMSEDAVQRIIGSYVNTAQRLNKCGFAGVELHGAHGYLIGQFLSPWSNKRDDLYGGDVTGRTRFVTEIAAGIRTSCSSDFIIGLKMPGDEGVRGGIDSEEALVITENLVRTANFDYFSYGQGNFSLSLENHVPDIHFDPGHFLNIHKKMRDVAQGVPVMALGRVDSPELAERVIAEGYGDIVGTSRTLIADPAWPQKALNGKSKLIRPSVFDNWCWGEVHQGKPLQEHHNPYLGEVGEAFAEERLSPTPTSRKISVVGGGPGGLETAWVAAARGHQVSLYNGSLALGGKLRRDAALPGRSEISKIIEYQAHLADLYGVEIRLGEVVDASVVRKDSPDVVVCATGSTISPPPALPGGENLGLDAISYIDAPFGGGRALFFDMDHGPTAYATVDLMAEKFEQVILVTPRPQIAQNVNYCSAIGVHRRLHQMKVKIVTAYDVVGFDGAKVTCENVFTGENRIFGDLDAFIYAAPRRANDKLSKEMNGDVELHLVGDCQSPRNLMAAIHGGHHLGRTL